MRLEQVMRNVTARIGRRPGGRTFMLLMLRNARERDRFRDMIEALKQQEHVPADTYAICSELPDHGGELLVVLPLADGPGRMIQAIKSDAAMRLSLHVGEAQMSSQDYLAYTALAVHAESRR